MKPTLPPRKLLRFFRWYCHPDLVDHIEGDLIEEYQDRTRQRGKRHANFRLAIELIRLCRPGIIRPWQSPNVVTSYSMYKSFIVVAWRNFVKSTGYASINIMGLAIALSACMLILLYVRQELSFDRFHEHADQIYRVNMEIKFGDNHLDVALATPVFAFAMKSELAQVEAATRIKWHGSLLVTKGNEQVRQENVAYADSTLFDLFTFPLIAGNSKTALAEPNSLVITESMARKFFGSIDALGKTLTIDGNQSRKITAIIKDLPSNSHFRFECFIPMIEDEGANRNIWAGGQNYATYLLLKQGTDVVAFETQMNKIMDRHLEPELKTVINKTLEEFKGQGDFFKASLTPIVDIHLKSNRVGELFGAGKIEYVYLFSVIAFFILTIAVVNFMNLATARSANRAREVGVRKVMGSRKSTLIQQFILESVLTCALSMVIAIVITSVALPEFNSLTGKRFDIGVLFNTESLLAFVALILIVGTLAGSYPAFYLSAFQPVAVLKGARGGAKGLRMRNVLVVFQFAASVTLIAGTIVMYMQMEYIRKRDLGFDRKQVLVVNNVWQLGTRVDPLKNSFQSLQGVENITVSGFLPVSYQRMTNTFFQTPTLDVSGAISMQSWFVDDQYISTMRMRIVEGRDFSKDIASDSSAIIINESAARFLGGKDIIGRKVYSPDDMERKSVEVQQIIGVVKDFNFSTLREQVAPLALMYGKHDGSIALKLNSDDVANVVAAVEKKWKALVPEVPFEYTFMDEDYNRLYSGERQVGRLITIFSALSIFISCLGLFGLATFMAEQRSKEIGIRKVLGASVFGITSLLSRDFLRLVIIAVVLATPLAWFAILKWLEGFAYRTEIFWWVFPLAGMVAVAIACVTVSYQSIRASVSNPVDSLRAE